MTLWTWNAQRKPEDRLDDIAQEADRTTEWDFTGIQEISATTARAENNKVRTTHSGHLIIVTKRPAGGFAVGIIVHARWHHTIVDITFGQRLVAVIANVRCGSILCDNTTLQFIAGRAPSALNNSAEEVGEFWTNAARMMRGKRAIGVLAVGAHTQTPTWDRDGYSMTTPTSRRTTDATAGEGTTPPPRRQRATTHSRCENTHEECTLHQSTPQRDGGKTAIDSKSPTTRHMAT